MIGVCDSEDKGQLVRDKGAFAAVNYQRGKMKSRVADITDGKGAKLIFDAVGGDLFKDCLDW